MKDVINWGILGLGSIANDFAQSLGELPDARIAAAGSRDIGKARAFCCKFGGKPHGSYAELVNDPDVDIVYVATLHHLHEEHALLALRAGKHVLCEKPIAITEASALRMYSEAEARGLFLMDGLWSRFFPAWEFAKQFIGNGELGRVVAINSITSWGALSSEAKPRLFYPSLSGGALLDGGIYSLAAVSVILGADEYPTSVKALLEMGPTGVDEHDGIIMQFPSGVIATILAGLQGPMLMTNILCESGTMSIPNHRSPQDVEVNMRRTNYGGAYGMESRNYRFPYSSVGFQFEAAHVHECLRGGLTESPRVTKRESLMLMRIADEARRQAGFKYPGE